MVIPKNAPQSHRRALTEEEQGWILNTPHKMQLAAVIMMYTGLRRGELLALTWPDINLADRTVTVNKSVEFHDGVPHVKASTKTNAGMRVISIRKFWRSTYQISLNQVYWYSPPRLGKLCQKAPGALCGMII